MIGLLRDRWEKIWQKVIARTGPQEVFEELIKAYSSADRFYHNLAHIRDCFAIFDQTKSLAVFPEEVELAIWFHDAVYDTRRQDNEQKSAEWARAVLDRYGIADAMMERVSNSILATRHDRTVTDPDAQLLVDVDLSILGSESDAFWRYEDNIRKEYAWVPNPLFREKRIEILRGFLDREFIYINVVFQKKFEAKARANLRQAITRLSDLSA